MRRKVGALVDIVDISDGGDGKRTGPFVGLKRTGEHYITPHLSARVVFPTPLHACTRIWNY